MNKQSYNFVKFEEKEVDLFLSLMDVEQRDVISFGDIESACHQLGLGDSFPNIKSILKEMVTVNEGELSVAELRRNLLKKHQTQKDEMEEIFNYLDYDDKGEINKNKLKIMIKELTDETISDLEAEDMVRLLAGTKKVVDLAHFLELIEMKIQI